MSSQIDTTDLESVSFSSSQARSSGWFAIPPVLRQVTAAAVLTAVLAAGVHVTVSHESWLYSFLFHRGPLQWLILGSGFLGLVAALTLHRTGQGEATGLARWQAGDEPGPEAGVVTSFYRRLRKAIAEAGLADPRQTLREGTEAIEADHASRYALLDTLIYVTPFVGLVGTLGGMSDGLRASFARVGSLDVSPFQDALSRSLENSYCAIGATVLLILVKQVIRARDNAVATGAGQLALDTVIAAEHSAVRRLGIDAEASPAAAVQQMARAVDGIAREVHGFGAAAVELVGKVSETLASAARHQAEVALERQALEHASSELTASVRTLVEGWDRALATQTVGLTGLKDVQAELAILAQTTRGIGQAVNGVSNAVSNVHQAVSGVRNAVDAPRVIEIKAAR